MFDVSTEEPVSEKYIWLYLYIRQYTKYPRQLIIHVSTPTSTYFTVVSCISGRTLTPIDSVMVTVSACSTIHTGIADTFINVWELRQRKNMKYL